jgi:hypothetical protein
VLQRQAANLIDNAIQHNIPGGQADILWGVRSLPGL